MDTGHVDLESFGGLGVSIESFKLFKLIQMDGERIGNIKVSFFSFVVVSFRLNLCLCQTVSIWCLLDFVFLKLGIDPF